MESHLLNTARLSGVELAGLKLRRSRRKTAAVKLQPDGTVELAVPLNASSERIQQSFEKFLPWLKKQTRKLAAQAADFGVYEFKFEYGSKVFFLGREYTLQADDIALHQGAFINGSCILCDGGTPEKIQLRLEIFYRNQARKILAEMLQEYTENLQINIKKFTISDTWRTLGSCGADGSLKFSWRLMMYPPELLELVVLHELAHRSVMNHSRQFHAVLESYLPDCRERDKLLQQWNRKLYSYPH